MTTLSMLHITLSAQERQVLPCALGAGFVLAGGCSQGITGGGFLINERLPVQAGAQGATLLIFALGQVAAPAIAQEALTLPKGPALLRLDEVSFPPEAIAYRHVHAGAGFRYLRHGQLHLQADDHEFTAQAGDHWFEAAGSPVRATASADHPETRFVRCMVLPPEYEGKPTIQILDAKDAQQPKRQSTHRHIDHLLTHLP